MDSPPDRDQKENRQPWETKSPALPSNERARPISGENQKSVHDDPESMFTLLRNWCSRWPGIDVHVEPELVFTMGRNTQPIGITIARNMKSAEAQKMISANGISSILRATDDGTLNTKSTPSNKTTGTLYLTVPSGFTLIDSGTGVRLYKKNYIGGAPDYVTVVNLGQATLRNLTGSVGGSNIYRKSLSSFWADMASLETSTRKRMLVVNGTFFATNDNPAGIAFGLKRNYNVISYGYGLQEYPGKIKTLAWGEWGPASINLYSKSTLDGNWSDVVGGLDETVDKSKYSRVPRTFAGIRDDDGNGYVETVFLYSSSYATQSEAANVLRAFGASSVIMFDGGGSTGLILRGTSIISPIRTLPHAIGVFTGK